MTGFGKGSVGALRQYRTKLVQKMPCFCFCRWEKLSYSREGHVLSHVSLKKFLF